MQAVDKSMGWMTGERSGARWTEKLVRAIGMPSWTSWSDDIQCPPFCTSRSEPPRIIALYHGFDGKNWETL